MAAPLLTRAQFAKTPTAQKPGASYGGYVRWVTQTRAARAARVAADPMLAFNQAMKLASGQARSDVNYQINAQVAAARAATRAAQDQANRQAARAQAASEGLAELTKTDPKQLQDAWQNTANLFGALGTGLTGAVGEAQRAEAARNQADIAGATGGLGGLSSLDPNSLQSIGQTSGVLLPGTTMSEQATNAFLEAGARNAAQVANIKTIADQYRQKSLDAQRDLADKVVAINATRPGLFQTALQARRTAAQNLLSTLTNVNYVRSQTRGNIAKTTGFDPVTGRRVPGATNVNNPSTSWSKVNGYVSDGMGRPIYKNGQLQVLPGYTLQGGHVVKTSTGQPVSRAPNNALSRSLGFLVDANGTPIRNRDGSLRVLPGYTWDPTTHQVVKTGAGPGGVKPLTTKDQVAIGSAVTAAFKGVPNTAYDKSRANLKPGDPNYDPNVIKQWSKKPMQAGDLMRLLLTDYPGHYAEIYRAMLRYARMPGSRWAYVLDWQNPTMGGTHVPKSGPPAPGKSRPGGGK